MAIVNISLEDLLSTGRLSFEGNEQFDNEIKLEETEQTVKWTVKNFEAYQDFGDKRYLSTVAIATNDVTVSTNGRLCLLFQYFGAKYEDEQLAFNDLSTRGLRLFAYDPATRLKKEIADTSTKWDASKGLNNISYSGDDESIINALHSIGDSQLSNFRSFCYPPAWCKTVTLGINIPMFLTMEDVDNYIATGDPTNSINPIPEDVKESFDFYYDIENSPLNDRGGIISTQTEHDEVTFKLPDSGDRIAWVQDEEDENLYHLKSTTDHILLKSGNDYTEVPFTTLLQSTYKGKSKDNTHYGNVIATNIPFKTSLEAEDYLVFDSEVNNDVNGEDTNMELSDVSGGKSITGVYELSGTDLDNVNAILFHNDMTFIESMKNAMWQYNSEPIEAVIDLYYCPFNLNVFIDSYGSGKLKFGSFTYTGQLQEVPKVNYTTINSSSKSFTLCDILINPMYNDFRDYNSLGYSVYLPYYGVVPLDNYIINKRLKIIAKFDIYTSQLKYYIFVDSKLDKSVECAIGRHMALKGSDWISKASSNLNSVVGVASAVAGLGITVATGGAAAAIGMATMGAGVSALQSAQDMSRIPNSSRSGTQTAGLNIYDDMSCYLIIDQYVTIKPTNLNSEYGKPCYTIGKLSLCNGYCTITDLKLKTSATDSEREEIKNMLTGGVLF